MNQITQKTTIPWWLTIILILEIWPMFVGPYLAITSPTFLGGPDASTLVVGSLIYLARNVAVGFAFLIAILHFRLLIIDLSFTSTFSNL